MRIEAPATRREALEDADYVIVMVMIGGVAPFEIDIQVPARFGIDQTVGDTLGPGGVFRGLRTIPFLLELADEMEEVCPDALLLNYANPMAINCWAVNAATDIETIGLCHSVQGTARQLAGVLQHPRRRGDLLGRGNQPHGLVPPVRARRTRTPIRSSGRPAKDPDIVAQDPIRFDMFKHFDYFVTESSNHMSEYIPYYRKNADLITQVPAREVGLPKLLAHPSRGVTGEGQNTAGLVGAAGPLPQP